MPRRTTLLAANVVLACAALIPGGEGALQPHRADDLARGSMPVATRVPHVLVAGATMEAPDVRALVRIARECRSTKAEAAMAVEHGAGLHARAVVRPQRRLTTS